MGEFNWVNLISQIPVVALFAWVILKIFFKTKEFVDGILERHEGFLNGLLAGHREERERRDEDWRSYMLLQRESYLKTLQDLTQRVDEHHKNSIKQASDIIDLLQKNREINEDRKERKEKR